MVTSKSPAPAAIATTPAAATPAAPIKLPARKKAVARKTAVQQVSPQASAPAQAEKTKKPKLVRDNFTMPKAEYAALDALKQRAALLSRPARKSELLRAGLQLLASLPDTRFLTALAKLPSLKADRDGFETKK